FAFLSFFFSSRRRHTRCYRDWSSDVCSSDLPAVLAQHALRGLEIGSARDDRVQSLILDLIDVDGGVPRGKERRGADAIADLRRQRVHLVAKYRLIVRQSAQIVVAVVAGKLAAQGRKELVAAHLKRLLTRPQLLDDFQARIVTARLDRQQLAAGCEAAGERGQHFLDLEVRAHTRPPGLGREYQVLLPDGSARRGERRIEQELVILAIDDEHGGANDERVSGPRTRRRLPAVREHRTQILDLLRVLVRGGAGQTGFLPVQ